MTAPEARTGRNDTPGPATAPPSFEDRLGDTLEALLEAGADSLDALADGLNRNGVTPPDGVPWTATTLATEFHRLGA